MQDLDGKVAVVTGGASGIGLALAHRFAGEGMWVVIGDVEPDALQRAVDGLRASGTEAEGIVTDVSDAAQVQALADATIARFGSVHVVCNNAGVGAGGLSWEAPLSTWQWVIAVNLWGVIHGVHSFVPLLMQQPEAHVVNTASMAGLVSSPFMGPYNASKHAVVAISETLHHELAMMAPHVKVSVVCPGWVNTRIHESDRNRPAHLDAGTDPSAAQATRDIMRQLIETGMPPEQVAEKVLTAIRDEQFWVLPHDDEEGFWSESVSRKLRSVESRSNPVLGQLLQ